MLATVNQLNDLERQSPDCLFPQPLLPHIITVEKKGPVFQPAPETGCQDVLGLELSRGSFHRCAFCTSRAAPSYSGDEVIAVFGNIAERLEGEIARRAMKPRAVFISPDADPFPPALEIQNASAQVVKVLAEHRIQAWLVTRGQIRPAVLDVLAAHSRFVKVTIPITTTERGIQRSLEQWTASPRLRLRQIAELRRRGIAVQVSLEPLVPDLTDTSENLNPLLECLAEAGVRHVTASYLFLRDGILENIAEAMGEPFAATIEDAFAKGPMLIPTGQSAARFLPRGRRQHGYANLMSLAANHGITVNISRLSNPDFAPPPPLVPAGTRKRLLPLFLEAGKLEHGIAAN